MFDILFGWRKVSKCKKLIRRVQCRLKLLKNKRCCIVRQSRDDVAQLLQLGHDVHSLDRVEQILKDERMLTVYDLLDIYCEFIICHLSYIRKHKDCPNDINEAVSTLIYASARCGELPELRVIRELFGERYGPRFTIVALELLPGNLVNLTIRENLTIKMVSDDAKYRLVDEIARTSCFQTEPLALDYTSDWQKQLVPNTESINNTKLLEYNSNNRDIVPNNGVHVSGNTQEESHANAKNITKDEGKIVHANISSEGSVSPVKPNVVIHKKREELGMNDLVSSSESSSDQMPEEMVYLDDIEEFKSPKSKDGNFQDQRFFVFKSSIVSTGHKFEVGCDGEFSAQSGSMNGKEGSRSSMKCRKRLRKRIIPQQNKIVNDLECAIYYGISPNLQKVQKKDGRKSCAIILDQFGKIVSSCSLEQPCYVCASKNDKDNAESPPMQPKRRIATLEQSQTGITYRECSSNGALKYQEKGMVVPKTKHDKVKDEMTLQEEAEKVSPRARKVEIQHPYLRAMTMPPERPKDSEGDNIFRSNSFPFGDDLRNGSCSSPHVHPKLPDYDELAQKFMALKNMALQKNLESKQ